MTDLDLVPTDDLIDVVMSRYDDAVFMGYKNLDDTKPSFVTSEFTGEPYRCLGLCAVLSHTIAHVRDDMTTPAEDGDDVTPPEVPQ